MALSLLTPKVAVPSAQFDAGRSREVRSLTVLLRGVGLSRQPENQVRFAWFGRWLLSRSQLLIVVSKSPVAIGRHALCTASSIVMTEATSMIDFAWQPVAMMLVIIAVVLMVVGPRRRSQLPDIASVERELFTAGSQKQPQKLHRL